jgi:hypothetical protein
MTQINDDIKKILKPMNNLIITIYNHFSHYFNEYYLHPNKSKNAVEIYKSKDDYINSKAKKRGFTPPYAFIVNDNHILFYFKKRSELSVLKFQKLQDTFGKDIVKEKDGLQKNLSFTDKATVEIRTSENANLLTGEYISV